MGTQHIVMDYYNRFKTHHNTRHSSCVVNIHNMLRLIILPIRKIRDNLKLLLIVLKTGLVCEKIKYLNTLRPGQNERNFADDILKCIFLNKNVWIQIKISLKFVPKCPIINIPALFQIMAWRRPGDEPLSEPMMVRLPTHICVTRPQWVLKSYTFSTQNHIRLHNKSYGNTIYCSRITSTENPANFFEWLVFIRGWLLTNQEVTLTANTGTIARVACPGA